MDGYDHCITVLFRRDVLECRQRQSCLHVPSGIKDQVSLVLNRTKLVSLGFRSSLWLDRYRAAGQTMMCFHSLRFVWISNVSSVWLKCQENSWNWNEKLDAEVVWKLFLLTVREFGKWVTKKSKKSNQPLTANYCSATLTSNRETSSWKANLILELLHQSNRWEQARLETGTVKVSANHMSCQQEYCRETHLWLNVESISNSCLVVLRLISMLIKRIALTFPWSC